MEELTREEILENIRKEEEEKKIQEYLERKRREERRIATDLKNEEIRKHKEQLYKKKYDEKVERQRQSEEKTKDVLCIAHFLGVLLSFTFYIFVLFFVGDLFNLSGIIELKNSLLEKPILLPVIFIFTFFVIEITKPSRNNNTKQIIEEETPNDKNK